MSGSDSSWIERLDADLEKDPRLGAYDLLGEIGAGASGTVYRARHRALGHIVALKKLRATSDVARERFRREARTAAGLRHPNVAAIHDAGEDFLVMELVEGPSFASRRDARLLEQAARGVGAAHAAGVVHRDLKPANVLVSAEGVAKVVDFGLARVADSSLTSEGAPLGTPLYMAPEQVDGKPVSPRTDVYALGAMLYEILGGHPPFRADTPHALYAKILREEPARLGAGALEAVARKALEKDPSRRYPDANAFADDLLRALEGKAVRARRRLRLPGWTWKAAVALGVALLVWGERQRRVELLREHARVALDAVLKLRRAGDVAGMAAFVPAVEAAYARAPERAETEHLMGRLRRALMDMAAAERHQERALALDPGYAPALYERAVLRAARWRPDDVEGERDILRDVPDSRPIRGLLALQRRDHAEARRILEEVVRDDPLLEEAWHGLATAAAREAAAADVHMESKEEVLKRYAEVEALWTRAIAKDVGYGPHWLGRGLLRRSRGLCFMKRGGDAVAEFRAAEADLKRARELKAEEVEVLSRRSNVRDLMGIELMGRNEDPSAAYDGAEADASEGMSKHGPRGELLISRAAARLHRAMWLARKREDVGPLLAEAEADLVRARGLEGWADEALNARGYLRLYRADLLRRRGADPRPELEAAEADLTEALRLRPDAGTYVSRGRVRQEKGDAAAEADYTEALRLAPALAEAWRRRGLLRAERGDPAAAADLARAAALAK